MAQERHYDMKDSGVEWIGEIPKDWAVERLKAMFSFGKGLPITKDDLVEQGIPVISYGQIHAKFNTGVEVLPQLLRYVDAKWLASNTNSLVSEGDFIFADTSEDMEGCGNCVYVDTLGEGVQLFAGYHTITFTPKRSKHNKFLAYLFKSDAWRSQLRSRVSGVKLFSISRKIFNLTTVIIPPLSEQVAIVAYLDEKCTAIDSIIAEAKATIEEYKAWKASVIFEAVTKGLDPNAEMKDSGVEWIGMIPKGWKVSAVKRHYSITLGKMLESTPKTPDVTLENYMCASNIKWGGIDISVNRQMWFSTSEKEVYFLRDGDLLVMEGGATAGTAAIYQGEFSPCYMQNSVNRCRSKNGNFTPFLYYWLYFVNHSGHIESVCNCATFKHLTKEKLGRLPLVQVPLPEQTAIADYLDSKCAAIDAIIAEKETLIGELEAYKKSLIFETVTGKRRVC